MSLIILWICRMWCPGRSNSQKISFDVFFLHSWNICLFIPFRLNQRILSIDDPNYLDVSGVAHTDLNNINALAQLSLRDMTATLMNNLKYFTSKHSYENLLGNAISFLTLWVVADVETSNGRDILQNALQHMVSKVFKIAPLPWYKNIVPKIKK